MLSCPPSVCPSLSSEIQINVVDCQTYFLVFPEQNFQLFYKVLIFPLLISEQFLMSASMILGSTKALIGHWIQQSGEGASCLPELWGVTLPAEPPLSLPSDLCSTQGVCRGSASPTMPWNFQFAVSQAQCGKDTTPGEGNQVQQRHGNLSWHMEKLRLQGCKDPWKPVYLVLAPKDSHHSLSDSRHRVAFVMQISLLSALHAQGLQQTGIARKG